MGLGGDGSQRAVARCGMEGVAICSLGLIWDGLDWVGWADGAGMSWPWTWTIEPMERSLAVSPLREI